MFSIFEVRVMLSLIFLFIASLTDIHKRIVPDKVSFSFIGFAILINFLDFNPINFLPGIIVFIIGLIIYYLGKLGGGDIKMITGLALMIPFFNGKTFVLQASIFAALTSLLFYSVYFTTKILRKKKILFSEIKKDAYIALLLFVFLLAYFILLKNFYSFNTLFLFFVPLFASLPFIALQQEIKKEFFLKEVTLNELDEDEVVAFEFLSKELQEKFKLKKIITEEDKLFLKKNGFNSIKIYSGMPAFMPFVFLGTLIALFNPTMLSSILII